MRGNKRNMQPKWLVIGSESTIGNALSLHLVNRGIPHYRASTLAEKGSHMHLTLGDNHLAWNIPDDVTVAFIFAAITSIKACKDNPATTYAINVSATIELIERLHRKDVFVIYPSTNMVYGGAPGFHSPNDPTCPTNEYASQKVVVENHLKNCGDKYAVVRLGKIIHDRFELFTNWHDSLAAGHEITVFDDLPFSPVHLDSVCELMTALAKRRVSGIYHATAERDITYYDAAIALAKKMDADLLRVNRTSAVSILGQNAVPKATALNNCCLWEQLGIRPPTADSALNLAIEGIINKPLHINV